MRRKARHVARGRLFLAVSTLFNALTLISIFSLVGLGLAISFGLMNVTNLAHGEFVTIGAFAVYFVQRIGGGFWLGMLAAPFESVVSPLEGTVSLAGAVYPTYRLALIL